MNKIKFEPTMVWSVEDVFQATQQYIKTLLDKIQELQTIIEESENND